MTTGTAPAEKPIIVGGGMGRASKSAAKQR